MRLLRVAWHRVRSLAMRPRVERDLAAEVELHLAQLVNEYRAAGMSQGEAERACAANSAHGN